MAHPVGKKSDYHHFKYGIVNGFHADLSHVVTFN